jgi:citrate lyase beta subunit
MQHFSKLEEADKELLFFKEPVNFTKDSSKELLQASLGATIYCPSIRPNLLVDVKKMYAKDASSVVICLEDSIPDERLEEGEQNVQKFLMELDALTPEEREELPLLFLRPRNPNHLWKIYRQNGDLLRYLTGFAFPKFDTLADVAHGFMGVLTEINENKKLSLYFMPILESPSIIYRETREAALSLVSNVLAEHKDSLLAVRIGATDMSSAYGLRRSPDFTIYDVNVVSSAIADIVNVFGRADFGTIITGCVWEHFGSVPRTLKPQLRESIFSDDKKLRSRLLHEDYDMLLREIQLDKINGITGKTVIHPTHIGLVHSLLVVNHEEYSDAMDILSDGKSGGGAHASQYKNKMNEVKPHTAWANKISNRADAFGVSNENIDFIDFLERFKF